MKAQHNQINKNKITCKNPRIFKNDSQSSLPVFYKWNNKTWMTGHVFKAWFTKYV